MSTKRISTRTGMNLYFLFFALGATGMIAMAILGVAGGHGGGRSHGGRAHGATPHSHAHAGHAHSGVAHSATHIAVAGRGAADARIAGAKVGARVTGAKTSGARTNGARGSRGARANGARGSFKDALSSWLSPRVLFTLSLGIGATGLLLEPIISNEIARALVSIVGGLFLEKALVAPLWELLMRFGSAPARTLESAVLEEAVALTAFDSHGCGLVSITLGGHEMRALARLKPNTDLPPPRVKSGDVLIVESVNAARGQCVVSFLRS